MKIRTVEELCEIFWQMEVNEDLLHWEICGVKAWQANRASIIARIAAKLGIVDDVPVKKNVNRTALLKRTLSALKGAVFYNPFVIKSKVDTIILESQRYKNVDGENLDIYTYTLEDELTRGGKKVLLLDQSVDGAHNKSPNKKRKYLDVMEIVEAIMLRVYRPKISEEQKLERRRIIEYVKKNTGVKISLATEAQIIRFKTRYHFYDILFSFLKPEVVYCICSYGGLAPMIKAAKDNKIEVIELQHGNFSKYSLGYSYPNNRDDNDIDYFPNKFYVWSDYWLNRVEMPIGKEKIVPYGFGYMKRRKEKYKYHKKEKNQIVILSQWTIATGLADTIYREINRLEHCQIKYKLHPAEYGFWHKTASLVELSKRDNVEIVQDGDLYEIFATSQYQIGVNSTALYEGLEFDLTTVIVDIPGMVKEEDLIEQKKAITFDEFLMRIDKNGANQ